MRASLPRSNATLIAALAALSAAAFACSSESTTTGSGSGRTIPGPSGGGGGGGGISVGGGGSGSGQTEPQPPPKPTSTTLTVTNTKPATGDGPMSITSVEAVSAGGRQDNLIKVTILGSTGAKKHQILVYFFADNGQLSSITHQWADDLSDVFQADAVSYCDALAYDQPVCEGFYHDFQGRFITLSGTFLAGQFPGNNPTASTLDGAIVYPTY